MLRCDRLAHCTDPEVTQVQFVPGRRLLLAVVSDQSSPFGKRPELLMLWDLSPSEPSFETVEVPSGKVTALYCPDLDEIVSTYAGVAYLGTDVGEVFTFAVQEQTMQKCAAINWRLLFPCASKLVDKNPVTAIKVRRERGHKVLFSFKHSGAIVWNMRVRRLTVNLRGRRRACRGGFT